MAHHCFPTENNVGTLEGYPSRDIREKNLANHIMRRGRSRLNSFVTSSMTLSAGTGLSVNVATGYAIINGFQIYSDAIENLAGLTASNTNYIWAALTKDGNGLVTDYALSANITGTPPTDSVLLGIAVTGAAAVSLVTNSVPNPTIYQGSYIGDNVNDRLIFLGSAPKTVVIENPSSDAGGNRAWCYSGMTAGAYGVVIRNATGNIVFYADNTYRPNISTYGFVVSTGANPYSINKSGTTFYYIAQF